MGRTRELGVDGKRGEEEERGGQEGEWGNFPDGAKVRQPRWISPPPEAPLPGYHAFWEEKSTVPTCSFPTPRLALQPGRPYCSLQIRPSTSQCLCRKVPTALNAFPIPLKYFQSVICTRRWFTMALRI